MAPPSGVARDSLALSDPLAIAPFTSHEEESFGFCQPQPNGILDSTPLAGPSESDQNIPKIVITPLHRH